MGTLSAKELYEMELHETKNINDFWQVLRVAGGWIYRFSDGDVFVPFNNEFQPE